MITSIAWRNIWRNKLRSAVIVASIAIGIIGAIITKGFGNGMVEQRAKSAISNEVSNIQIHNPKFLLNQDLQYYIHDAPNIIHKIKKLPEVTGISLRLEVNAMAASADAGAGISLFGVQPEAEKKVSSLYKRIIKGNYLKSDQKLPTVIGQKLSKKLNLGLEDKLIVTLTDTTGTITSGAFNIVGIYKTDDTNFDVSHVYVKSSDLAKLVNYPQNIGNEIAISLHSNKQTNKVVKELDGLFAKQLKQKEIIIQSWEQIVPLTKSLIDMMNYFSYLFLIIILASLAFAIINTMLMSVMERTREFGMLMALGMNKIKVFTMILLETVFLSIIGGIFGLVFSILIVQYFAKNGFDLSSVASGMNSLGFSSKIYFSVNNAFYVLSVALVILIAIISSIFPARKALKLQPATAIRSDD
jgi:ABC-type lipoprotein release transport system permease subunit